MTNSRDARNIRKGYQEALLDVLAKLDEGGEEAGRQWIKDNLDASLQPMVG